MHLCQLNYLGNTKVDTSLITIDVCSQISSIKQVYCKGGRMQHDTPDDIFNRFPILADSSLENNTGWSIQLCSYYLVVFSKDL